MICIFAVGLVSVGICKAQDSLKDKLAKLEAASKSDRSERKVSAKAETAVASPSVTLAETLDGKVKTLAERLSEMESRQKGMQDFGKGLDTRLTELELKFEASRAQSHTEAQKAHDALYAKLGELERKLISLESGPAVKEPHVGKASEPHGTFEEKVPISCIAHLHNDVRSVDAQPGSPDAEPVASNLLDADAVQDPDDIWHRETLTNGFGGLADKLADSGIEVGLSFTNIYQANVKGGLSTNQRHGRHTGSYDLEIGLDAEKLWGMEGGSMLVHAEGSWPRVDIDETSVGSVFGVNGDGAGRRAMDVTEVWYEQAMCDETLRLRLGKMDFAGGFECRGCPVSFDGSAYANDETAQFLNGALVNNPTIPMPDMGLGAILYWNPVESWYASIGAIDAQADARETGFRTAFTGEDYFFYAAETGVAPQFDSGKGPMPGAYRVGVWNDPQDKERFSDSKIMRDDTGFYISCDQMVYKENEGVEDSQGLGVFTRAGWANKKVNDITDFLSLGFQYQGLLEGRDDDVLGLGYAKGIFSTEAGYADAFESVFEVYYNAQVAPWVAISPSVQFVDNPGGDNAVEDAVIFGLRAQSAF